ncbi:MAG TPA: methyltransferase domain-containing protein [Candidatus Margulisiibacteriota bacterium]|nr:methyltransferase domain-containing protein [Candidatus Margulisiibacteriota bacterium]
MAIIAGYPAHRVLLDFGRVQTQLFVVEHLEAFVDSAALLRDADAPEPPYWAHVWPGARALARLLATQVDCHERRVVEIGCGLGLAGLTAALRGASVTAVDTAHAALRFVQASAQLNGRRVTPLRTDICRVGIRGRFDYCLAADATYDPMLQTALADFLAAHLAPDGHAWCAESVRTFDRGFQRACEQHGLQVTEREVREPDDGREVAVRITEVSWKSQVHH